MARLRQGLPPYDDPRHTHLNFLEKVMAYKNIVFIKLEKRLLNDHRWWTMSDYSQLIYIKLILMAAETYNKIPRNEKVLMQAFRSSLTEKDFSRCLKEIMANFPKLKANKHFMYFENFETKTNWLSKEQSLSNRRAIAKTVVEQDKEQEKEKEKEKESEPTDLPVCQKEAKKIDFLTKELTNGFKPKEVELLKTRIEQYLKHPVGTEANDACYSELINRVHAAKGVRDKMAYAVASIKNWGTWS